METNRPKFKPMPVLMAEMLEELKKVKSTNESLIIELNNLKEEVNSYKNYIRNDNFLPPTE